MKAHYDNDIWTKREKPPADWTKPLPAFMEERNKNTYLEKKNQEYKDEEEKFRRRALNPDSEPTKNSFCTFMWIEKKAQFNCIVLKENTTNFIDN